jgi:hypothetical protein
MLNHTTLENTKEISNNYKQYAENFAGREEDYTLGLSEKYLITISGLVMTIKKFSHALLACFIFCAAITAQADSHTVFELRTYTTFEGKLPALHKRFTNHTLGLFEKHGMRNIGYWVPQDPDKSTNTLIYIVSHKSREAAENSWQAFGKDPVWQKVNKESIADGEIVKKVESVFMTATEYSLIK